MKMIKKILSVAIVLSLIFTCAKVGNSFADVQEGENIIPTNLKWTSFSVRDDLHTGVNTEWETALCKDIDSKLKELLGEYYTNVTSFGYGVYDTICDHRAEAMTKLYRDFVDGKVSYDYYQEIDDLTGYERGVLASQSWTHGKLTGTNNSQGCTLDCSKTLDDGSQGTIGWDGEYVQWKTGQYILVGDNPWGLQLTMDGIPVEFGRLYTMEFDIASTLTDNNNQRQEKHAMVSAYDYQSQGGPAAEFESLEVNGVDNQDKYTFVINKTPSDSSELVYTHVKATFGIPYSNSEWSNGKDTGTTTHMGIRFALGAFLKSYPEEAGLTGKIDIKNMKVVAGGEAPTRVTTEAPTEITTEATTEMTSDETAEVPTQAPTDETTEVSTDVPSVETTEAITDIPAVETTEVKTVVPKETSTAEADITTNKSSETKPIVVPSKKDNSKLINQIKNNKPTIKKAIKKKSAKKIKVTLKNDALIADGYNVNVYKKKAKKPIVKKTIVGNKKSFVISSKKIKKLKKIFVKVRAFKSVDGIKHYGKWSKMKKVKIK